MTQILGKKGTVVDWSISMGIFIVAVASLLVFFRPSLQTQNQLLPLVDLIENAMVKNLTYSVLQMPLFITTLQDQTAPPPQPVELQLNLNPSWEFTNIDTLMQAGIQALFSSSQLRFKCQSGTCTNVQFIITAHQLNQQDINAQLNCIPSSGYCDAILGSAYELKGLNKASLLSTNYQQVKTKIGFPANNDFAITIDIGTGQQQILGPTPPQVGNRYATQLKNWFLDVNGNREPVTIGVIVW